MHPEATFLRVLLYNLHFLLYSELFMVMSLWWYAFPWMKVNMKWMQRENFKNDVTVFCKNLWREKYLSIQFLFAPADTSLLKKLAKLFPHWFFPSSFNLASLAIRTVLYSFFAFLLGCWTPNAFSTSEPEQGHSNHGHKPNQDSHYSLQWAHSEKG